MFAIIYLYIYEINGLIRKLQSELNYLCRSMGCIATKINVCTFNF